MSKYVDFVNNNRIPLFILLVILNILALLGIAQVKINPDFDIFMPEKSTYKKVLDDMQQKFGASNQMIFLLEDKTRELSPDIIRKYRNFQQYLEKTNNIKHIKGPAPETIIAGRNHISLDNILKIKVTDSEINQIKYYYDNIGKLSPLTQKDNKIYGSFTIFPGKDFGHNNLNKIENYLKNNNIKFYASGDLYTQQKIIDYILMILLFIPPTALLLILAIFRFQMGSLKATFLSVLPAGIGALWTVGLVGWIGKEVSIITVLAPVFTIVIGSADGLHFVSHVQEARKEGYKKLKSIVETLKMVGIPMIITTITSMVGFLSLLVMNTNAIQDLALFASIGIFLAGIITWYVLPLILTGDVTLVKKKKQKSIFFNKMQRIWGTPTIFIVLVLLVISFFGFQKVNTEFNQLMIYKDNTSIHKSFEKIMEVNDGSIPVYLYAKTDRDPLKPSYANSILSLEKELTASNEVGKTMSVYDFYSIINSNFNNLENPQYPDNLMTINFMNNMISGQEINPTNNLVNRNQNALKVMIFPVNLKNKTLDQINSRIQKFNKNHNNIEAQITGVQYLMRELNNNMINNQTKTLGIAFLLIFILLYISLKKLKPAFISLLPIGFTVIILYGFLGLSGISLNLFTATIFSITIGVGIDYAIHFTSVWMSFKNRGFNSREAVKKSYNYTSRPILANAFGLAIGLSALLLSPLRIHFFVSVLMWVSMMAGVLLSLSFLPTVLSRIKS